MITGIRRFFFTAAPLGTTLMNFQSYSLLSCAIRIIPSTGSAKLRKVLMLCRLSL